MVVLMPDGFVDVVDSPASASLESVAAFGRGFHCLGCSGVLSAEVPIEVCALNAGSARGS